MVCVKLKEKFGQFTLDLNWQSKKLVTVLFGPSGSGKSLTLKAIAGVISVAKGYITVNGCVFFDSERGIFLSPQKRLVGYLPQNLGLFPHLSVYDNLCYGKNVDKLLLDRLISISEVSHLLHKYPKDLSGGEAQRIALIRALAVKPRLLLLDEPFSALHKSLKEVLIDELKNLVKEYGIPVVFVSHDLDEVLRVGDYAVIYHNGMVIQAGDVNQVYLKPKTKEVAYLFGHRNTVEVDVLERERTGVKLRLPSGEIILLPLDCEGIGKRALLLLPSFSLALKKDMDTVKIRLKLEKVEDVAGKRFIYLIMANYKLVFHMPQSLAPNLIIEPSREFDFFFSSRLLHLMPLEE